MKFFIVILSVVAVAFGQLANSPTSSSTPASSTTPSSSPTSTPTKVSCDFSLNTVKSLHGREEAFRTSQTVDPTDSTKKFTKYSKSTTLTGVNTVRIKVGDDFIAEEFKTEGTNFVTQKGQVQTKSGIIKYEKTADGYKFKHAANGNTFDVPIKSLDAELPATVKLDDASKTTFNTIITLHKKLYAIKAKMDKENPTVRLYTYTPTTKNGYILQYYETSQGLTESSDSAKTSGRYKCGSKVQEFNLVKNDVQLVGEPKLAFVN